MAQDNTNTKQSTTVLTPTVGASYGNGWRQMWKYFLELFLIGIIGFIIGIPAGLGGSEEEVVTLLGVLGFIYGILIVGPTDYGVAFAYLKAARDDPLEVKEMFQVFHNYWNAVLANLAVMIIVAIGFILFVIPGIIFACKLVFVPYLVVDLKMDVIEAVKGSWRITNGHAWKVFFIGLLAIPISIAGWFCFGVGIIVAIMWVSLTLASLYHAVNSSVKELS